LLSLTPRVPCQKEGEALKSEDARIGRRVRVRDSPLIAELRGKEGTITGRWGSPNYVALDVMLDDGTSQLFWHFELEEIE
jgi:hypothetical protein